MKHYLEIRTTISPTPFFFHRIHYLAASLRQLGGKLADHEIVVSVGGTENRQNLYRTQPWSNDYPIIWRLVSPEMYAARGYDATEDDRTSHLARAELLMLVDADVLFVGDVRDLLDDVESSSAIYGVMAQISPFMRHPELPPQEWWQILAEEFGIGSLPLEYEHCGWKCTFSDEMYRHSPAYFNGGMIVGPTALMEDMFSWIPSALRAVDSVIARYSEQQPHAMWDDSRSMVYFRPQIARTLAMYKASLPRRIAPLRYNFPNDERFAAVYPNELSDIRIVHYWRLDGVHRDRDFMNAESIAGLIGRTGLSGANEILRRRIEELHESVSSEWKGVPSRGSSPPSQR